MPRVFLPTSSSPLRSDPTRKAPSDTPPRDCPTVPRTPGWKKSVTLPPCKTDTSPLIHMSLCPDKPILAGFVESFAPCSVSTLAGPHDDADVICLRQRVVNVMRSGCRVASHLREGCETLIRRWRDMKHPYMDA